MESTQRLGGEGLRSGTWLLETGGHRPPLRHPSFPVAPPWEPRLVQVIVFGFIFCWARLSLGRGGGREKRRGEGTALSAQSPEPLLLPSLAWLPPSSGGTSLWAQWGPDPWGTSSLQAGPAGRNRPLPSPLPFHPAESQKGLQLQQSHAVGPGMGKLRPGERAWLPKHTAPMGRLHLPSSCCRAENPGRLPPTSPWSGGGEEQPLTLSTHPVLPSLDLWGLGQSAGRDRRREDSAAGAGRGREAQQDVSPSPTPFILLFG